MMASDSNVEIELDAAAAAAAASRNCGAVQAAISHFEFVWATLMLGNDMLCTFAVV